MQPKVVALILALTASVVAWPSADPVLVDVSSKPASSGHGEIVYVAEQKRGWFGPDKVCGTAGDAPKCDGKHGAQNNVCKSLLDDFYGDPDTKIQKSPRQMCYKGEGGYCCVSWSKDVKTDITKKDLIPYIEKMNNACAYNGVSGRTENVNLGGNGCSTVCLSNRGTGCK